MEFVISGAAPLRHFSKFLAALGRIGTHVALEPTPGALRLSAVNPSKSAFAVITLLPAFFESYRGAGECGSLLVKSLLSVFRNKVERTVSRCIVRLGVEGDDRDRLVLQLVCENGVLKTHRLHYTPATAIRALYSKQTPHNFRLPPKLARDLVLHFSTKLEEITLHCEETRVRMESFVEWGEELAKRELKTNIELGVGDLLAYRVNEVVDLTVNFKELKGVLTFSDAVEQPVNFNFERSGRPIVLSVGEDGAYVADFVMATIDTGDDEDGEDGAGARAAAAASGAPAAASSGAQRQTQQRQPTASNRAEQTTQAHAGSNHATPQASAPRRPPTAAPSQQRPSQAQAPVPRTAAATAARPTQAATRPSASNHPSAFMVSRPANAHGSQFAGSMPALGATGQGFDHDMHQAPDADERQYWQQPEEEEEEEALPPTPPKRQGRLIF